MFNTKLEKRISFLETWVENISSIQKQLLEDLGYELEWQVPPMYRIKLVKIKKEKD